MPERGVEGASTSGRAGEQETKDEGVSSKEKRGRSRNRKNRDAERMAIREMTRQDLAEKRKKERRQKESTRRTPIAPVIASPHLKRPRDGEGDWVHAEAHQGEAGAMKAPYRVREGSGKPARSETPKMRSLPRMNQWNEDNVLPTLDIFTRSISAGPSVTELFPGLSAFRVKPNMLARYYVDDGRMLARREAIKKIMEEQEEFGNEREEKLEFGGRNTENQRKPRPSGSNSGLGTPKRRNRMAPIMGNSPKISEYFTKGASKDTVQSDNKGEQDGVRYEQENKAAVAMKMTTNVITLHEKPIRTGEDDVKYEQEEDLSRAMKMFPGVTPKHEKPVKKEEDQEDMTVSGEYFEEYMRFENKQKKEESKYEIGDSLGDELMEVGNNNTTTEEVPMPMDMLNAEIAHESELQPGEQEKEGQMRVRERAEAGTQEVNAIEAYTRSTT